MRAIRLYFCIVCGFFLCAQAFAGSQLQETYKACEVMIEDTFVRRNLRGETDFVRFNSTKQRFEILIPIHFRAESFVGKRLSFLSQVPARTRKALELVADFYASQGLYVVFKPTFDLTQRHSPTLPPENSILVYMRYEMTEIMTSFRWGLNPSWAIQDLAKVYAHEVGHFFKLKDEYSRPYGGKETKTSGEPDSLMRDWSHPNVRLYPRHIKKILEPICTFDQ